ncbi:hypothetical protein ACFL02_04415 [Planctomycetota bacterium]
MTGDHDGLAHPLEFLEQLAFSPDGLYIATGGSSDKKVQLWDARTYSFITSLEYNAAIDRVIFSPEGDKILAYIPQTSTIDIREVSIEKIRDPADKTEDYVTTFSEPLILSGRSPDFSPDGKFLLYANGFQVFIVDMDTGTQREPLIGHKETVKIACFSSNGSRIVTGSSDGQAKVWDTEEVIAGQQDELMTLYHGEAVTIAAFSPDDKLILTASATGLLKVWDAGTFDEITVFEGHRLLRSAVFSPDSKQILTGSVEKTRVCDAYYSPGESIIKHSTTQFNNALAVNSDGTLAATLSLGRQLDILNLERNEMRASFAGLSRSVDGGISFSNDGKRIAATLDDFTPVVIDLASQRVESVFTGHEGKIWSVNFSPDGSRVISTSWDNTARVWDSNTAEQLFPLLGHEGTVFWGAFSPDGTRIVTASADKNAILWDSNTGRRIYTLKGHSNIVFHAAFNHDGTKIVTSSADNTAIIWNADTGEREQVLQGHSQDVRNAYFSPDGARIVTFSRDSISKLWDPYTGDEWATLRGYESPVRFSLLDPGGAIFWFISYDESLQKREAAPWRLEELPGNDSMSWKERFALFQKQARVARTSETIGRLSESLTILTTLEVFRERMERFRDALQAEIPKKESFSGLQIQSGPMRDALARLCFHEGDQILSVNEQGITDYSVAAQEVERLLNQVETQEQPDITMEIRRQDQQLIVKFQLIPLKVIKREVSLPRAEVLAYFQAIQNESEEWLNGVLDSNRGYAQDMGEPLLEPEGLNGFWMAEFGGPFDKQSLSRLGLAIRDRIVRINNRPITSIAVLREIYDEIIQSLQKEGEYALSMEVERGELQRLLLTIKVR